MVFAFLSGVLKEICIFSVPLAWEGINTFPFTESCMEYGSVAGSFRNRSINRTTYIHQFGSLAVPHRRVERSVINGTRYSNIRGKDPGEAGNRG